MFFVLSSKIYDKRDEFDIVNFLFLDGDLARATSCGNYISQLIRIARVSSQVADLNTRNKILTMKFLKESYRYHKLDATTTWYQNLMWDSNHFLNEACRKLNHMMTLTVFICTICTRLWFCSWVQICTRE